MQDNKILQTHYQWMVWFIWKKYMQEECRQTICFNSYDSLNIVYFSNLEHGIIWTLHIDILTSTQT